MEYSGTSHSILIWLRADSPSRILQYAALYMILYICVNPCRVLAVDPTHNLMMILRVWFWVVILRLVDILCRGKRDAIFDLDIFHFRESPFSSLLYVQHIYTPPISYYLSIIDVLAFIVQHEITYPELILSPPLIHQKILSERSLQTRPHFANLGGERMGRDV